TDDYPLSTFTIVGGLSVATVNKIKVTSPKDGVGPLVTGTGIQAGSRVGADIGINPNDRPLHQSFAVLGSKEHPLPLPYKANEVPPSGTYVFSGFDTTLSVIDSSDQWSGAVGSGPITLTGSGFAKAKGVTFNGFPVPDGDFTVNNDASI